LPLDHVAPVRGYGEDRTEKGFSVAQFDPDLGLAPPGYDLSPSSGLRIASIRAERRHRDERSAEGIARQQRSLLNVRAV
jgi:hypothetical protein